MLGGATMTKDKEIQRPIKKKWSREISTVDSEDREIQMLLKKGGKGNFPL